MADDERAVSQAFSIIRPIIACDRDSGRNREHRGQEKEHGELPEQGLTLFTPAAAEAGWRSGGGRHSNWRAS